MLKKKRGRPLSKSIEPEFVHYRVRFPSAEMVKISAAAARRGFGTQEFIRLACNLTADKVLAQSAEQVLGLSDDVFASSTPANAG